MYRSFTIKNFRCFRELTIAPLERVNLIAGMNNVGKTALLEAIFLHLGPNAPELSMRINSLRGIERADNAEEVWGGLFFGRRIEQPIELTSDGEDDIRRTLQFRLVEPEQNRSAPPGNTAVLTTAIRPSELKLEYRDTNGQTGISSAFFTAEGVKVERARLVPLSPGILLSSRALPLSEDVKRFSELERVDRQAEVLATLQLLEPRLRRLTVLVTDGTPMIYGDIGIGSLVPLPHMGEGVVRLLTILLALATIPGAVLLIDEIENGLHHSVLVEVWKVIAVSARRSEAQIFATTHDWDCIRAAHEAFEASGTYDFLLHRLDRVKDETRAVTYDQEMLEAAMVTDLEVR